MAHPQQSIGISGLIFGSVGLFIGAVISGVIIEWIGMIWWWPELGARHSMEMVVQEAGYLNHEFVNAALFGWSPLDVANWIALQLTGAELGATTIDPHTYGGLTGMATQQSMTAWLAQYILASIYIIIVCIIRMLIIGFTLPLYLLFYAIAFCDGLMIRDLRRFGGARESGIRHHFAKRLVVPSLWAGWGIYLAIPVSIHPNWILVPSVLIGSFFLWVASQFFKKYL